MALNLNKAGKKSDMTTAVNAMTVASTAVPGASDHLARVQAFVNGEIAAFGGAANVVVLVSGGFSSIGSTTHVVVQPVRLDNNGNIVS